MDTGLDTQATTPVLVVVTGPPAAGKTTFARELARQTGFVLFDKDGIKERLFDRLGVGDRAWSMRLGAATFPLLFDSIARVLVAGHSTIVEAPFDQRDVAAFGALPACRFVQVVLGAPERVLLERFNERMRDGSRHPGHHSDPVVLDEVRAALAEGRWGRLDLPGRVLAIDTTGPIDWPLVHQAMEGLPTVVGRAVAGGGRCVREPLTLAALERVIRMCWGPDTFDPDDGWSPENPARGHCDVTCLVVHDYLGGELMAADFFVGDRRAGGHMWNLLPGGIEVDLTRDQFRADERIGAGRVRPRPASWDPQHSRYHRYEAYLRLADRVRAALVGVASMPR